jgi:hypothetical protein
MPTFLASMAYYLLGCFRGLAIAPRPRIAQAGTRVTQHSLKHSRLDQSHERHITQSHFSNRPVFSASTFTSNSFSQKPGLLVYLCHLFIDIPPYSNHGGTQSLGY